MLGRHLSLNGRLGLLMLALHMLVTVCHAGMRHHTEFRFELCQPELVRQNGDRMLVENFTPIVKVDENGRPLMLVRRTGPDGKEVDVWATPKDQELADNFVKNSAGEWEPRGEQERHRKFADERFISDYLVPSMQDAQGSTIAFVEVNAAIATVVAGGAGVSGFAPKVIGMSKEALSELTGIPVGLKDLKDGAKLLFTKKGIQQGDEIAGAIDAANSAPARVFWSGGDEARLAAEAFARACFKIVQMEQLV